MVNLLIRTKDLFYIVSKRRKNDWRYFNLVNNWKQQTSLFGYKFCEWFWFVNKFSFSRSLFVLCLANEFAYSLVFFLIWDPDLEFFTVGSFFCDDIDMSSSSSLMALEDMKSQFSSSSDGFKWFLSNHWSGLCPVMNY